VTVFVTANGTSVLVEILDAVTGARVFGSDIPPFGLDFTRDGKYMALAGENNTDIYRTGTWEKAISLTYTVDTAVYDVRFSPDGKQIVTSTDGGFVVSDAATGKEAYRVNCDNLIYVNFTPDAKHYVAYVGAGEYKVWDASLASQPDVQPVSIYAARGPSGIAGFTPDGKRMIVGSSDGTDRVWALDLDDLVTIAKSRLTRTLTTGECQQYLHVQECPAEQ
jgi:WD40 repeat protein